MYQIVGKKTLNPTVTQMEIFAPFVAKKALAGQFVILRVDEEGERIPLTVAGVNQEKGAVKIIFQVVGGTTKKLSYKDELFGASLPVVEENGKAVIAVSDKAYLSGASREALTAALKNAKLI